MSKTTTKKYKLSTQGQVFYNLDYSSSMMTGEALPTINSLFLKANKQNYVYLMYSWGK